MNLNQTNCVITGVAGATGTVIREVLLNEGAVVIGTIRPRHDLQELKARAPRDYTIEMNPGDLNSVQSATAKILASLNQIHVWINVVGGFQMGQTIEDYSQEGWARMYALNFQTVLNTSQVILPHFKERKFGRLINFGSSAALEGFAKAGPYLVSKAAVHALTKATAAELEGDITCNAILPSTIDTQKNREAMPDEDTSTWVKPGLIAEHIIRLIQNSNNGELLIL